MDCLYCPTLHTCSPRIFCSITSYFLFPPCQCSDAQSLPRIVSTPSACLLNRRNILQIHRCDSFQLLEASGHIGKLWRSCPVPILPLQKVWYVCSCIFCVDQANTNRTQEGIMSILGWRNVGMGGVERIRQAWLLLGCEGLVVGLIRGAYRQVKYDLLKYGTFIWMKWKRTSLASTLVHREI